MGSNWSSFYDAIAVSNHLPTGTKTEPLGWVSQEGEKGSPKVTRYQLIIFQILGKGLVRRVDLDV